MFGRVIQGRGGFIQEQPVGLLKDGTCDCKSLLFAAAHLHAPVVHLVQPLDERLESDGFEDLDRSIVKGAKGGRVSCRFAQRRDRQVRTLGDKEQVCVFGDPDLAFAECSDARQCPEERALACRRAPGDEQTFAWFDRKVHVRHDHTAVGKIELHLVGADAGGTPFGTTLMPPDPVAVSSGVHRVLKRQQSIGRRLPARQRASCRRTTTMRSGLAKAFPICVRTPRLIAPEK